MDLNYFVTLEQKQHMAQSQIQSLEILALCNAELDSFLQNEYMENPLMEYSASKEVPDREDEFHDRYEKQAAGMEGYEEREDKEQRSEIAAQESIEIKNYLKSQIDHKRYNQTELSTIEFLFDCLDDNGFFTTPAQDIANMIHVKTEIVEKCLSELQQLEPYGIFAPDLSQCLLRQLEVLGVDNEEIRLMVRNHLADISEGKISKISRALKLSSLQVRKYIALIVKLHPRPLAGFQSEKTMYIIPDIIFSYQDREWKIVLNDNWMGNYSLNDYYLRMMQETKDQELQEYFRSKLERARFILNCMEQRRKTLLQISETVLGMQEKYFMGKEEARPMTMNEVANRMGIHVSTVSRAMKGKYIQFPKGTIVLKSLFATAVAKNNNEEANTPAQIKLIIKKMIEQEDKKRPYSDQTLMQLLKEKGICVSRRVVAKYREELGIKGSFERKDI